MNNEIKQNILRDLELTPDDICAFLKEIEYTSEEDSKIITCVIEENLTYDYDRNNIFANLSDKATKEIKECVNHEKQKEETEKQEDEEVFYTVGDKFKQSVHDEIYQLHNLGSNLVALVKITRDCGQEIGYIWMTSESGNVKDIHKITQEEFARIANSQQEHFNLIKE